MDRFEIIRVDADGLQRFLAGLADVLNASVRAGASVSFVLPHSLTDSKRFWLDAVRPGLQDDTRILLAAVAGDEVAGTVQLDCDMPPNQPHRAEVLKLIVHPSFRRRGIARSLMVALEAHARTRGRMLLNLDTASSAAERLYGSLGFSQAGIIPGFARDPIDGHLEATTIMYKQLSQSDFTPG